MKYPATGSANIRRGIIAALAGPILVLAWRFVLGNNGGSWLYGASIPGGLLLAIGIGQRLHFAMLSPAQRARIQVEASRAGLMRTMDAVKNERQSRPSLPQVGANKGSGSNKASNAP